MLSRSLSSLLVLLVLALALPALAGADSQHFATGAADPASLTPKQTLHKAQAARRGAGDGRELTPLLKELAVKLPALGGADRRRAQRLLARPTLGESTSADNSAYTTAEHNPPFCSAHFCVHWVDTTKDAPPLTDSDGNGVPDYVDTMSGVFENSFNVENTQLGWRAPKPDGSKGCPGSAAFCMNKTDVYIVDLGGQGIYGYSAPDPNQGRTLSQYGYLVLDNDYSASQFVRYGGNFLPPMEVTAAHEYNHVLQFAYDLAQDTWMFESSAVWMEDKVYTDVNDYLMYLDAWKQMSFVPLTTFNAQRSDDPINVKVYGDIVWNRWLEGKFGQDIVRTAWEHSLTTKPKSFAPGAYDQAVKPRGSSFFAAFTQFAADTAEWRASNTAFAEGSSFPDMERLRDTRSGALIQLQPDQGGAGGRLDHTTFGLLNVSGASGPRVKLVMNAARGKQVALALVGRQGDEAGGTYTTVVRRLPGGGIGTVTLPNPGIFSRITAVLINADGRTTGRFSQSLQDWQWKGDSASISSRLSTDFTPPSLSKRSPGNGQSGVARNVRLKVQFSERMFNASEVLLIGPGHHKVKARVKVKGNRTVQLKPAKALRSGARYIVRLSKDVRDLGGNELPTSARSWSFRTR